MSCKRPGVEPSSGKDIVPRTHAVTLVAIETHPINFASPSAH
jgi:hypothetical protein